MRGKTRDRLRTTSREAGYEGLYQWTLSDVIRDRMSKGARQCDLNQNEDTVAGLKDAEWMWMLDVVAIILQHTGQYNDGMPWTWRREFESRSHQPKGNRRLLVEQQVRILPRQQISFHIINRVFLSTCFLCKHNFECFMSRGWAVRFGHSFFVNYSLLKYKEIWN